MTPLLSTRISSPIRSHLMSPTPRCDVFINHRGADTKRTLAGLLYNQLAHLNLHPFLDSKSMKPGDKLLDRIELAIRNCKLGIAVFSPRYCESYFCLRELALIVELKKKVIPIFYDIRPSELCVVDDAGCPPNQIKRYRMALQEAKCTVGITFDSSKENWSDLITKVSDLAVKSIVEERYE